MYLSLSLFYGSLFFFYSVVLSHGNSEQRLIGVFENAGLHDSSAEVHEGSVDIGSVQSYAEDVLEDPDFEDDDSDVIMNLFHSDEEDTRSLTHLHKDHGEILVPCFGMWWPVGGGGGGGATYDYYGGDYYGDYRKKKRRRSRKKKKAAKMKKKKS